MAAFKFRAQPALELRRREYESAQRALARANAERQQANARVYAAERAASDARAGADQAMRTAPAAATGEWYRFWIVRLDGELAVAKVHLARRDEMLAAAQAACLQARQRYEALDRLREKAQAAYLAGISAAEKKIIDDLATQRYALRRDGRQGA